MKTYVKILALLLAKGIIAGSAMAQAPLTGYSHAMVVMPVYGDGQYDVHGLGQYLQEQLRKETDLIIIPDSVTLPAEVPLSQLLFVGLDHWADDNTTRNHAGLYFYTSNRNHLHTITNTATSFGMTIVEEFQNAIDKGVDELNKVRPSFDQATTNASMAERFEMPPDDFYAYLDDTGVAVEDIEGVWQQEDGLYVVGVIRTPGSRIERYTGFIVEKTAAKQEWEEGIVKFELTPTVISGRYTASYKMADFDTKHMQVSVKPGIISFTYTPAGREQQTFTYIKMYPGSGLDDPIVSQAEESL